MEEKEIKMADVASVETPEPVETINEVSVEAVPDMGSEPEKTEKKKMGLGKKILLFFGGLILVILLAGAALFLNPKLQMKVMTDFVMKNLSAYNWSSLQMEDPVKPSLVESLGEDKTESVETLYSYMKDSSAKISYQMVEADSEAMTATVEVSYVDGSAFIEEYGNELGDYIVRCIDDGTMEIKDIMNVMEMIPDAENSGYITAAREATAEAEQMATTTMTINFAKQYGFCVPQGTSDEVNDVVSAGLSSNLEGIENVVAVRIIPQIVDRIFHIIQTFDEDELKKYTGTSISDLVGLSENNLFYSVIIDYLKTCGAEMEYTVGDFNKETGTIEVACSYVDSKNVISMYLKNVAYYALTHMFSSPMPDENTNAELLRSATEEAEKERLEKTVTITFDQNDYSNFSVSDEILDVASANLNSELKAISEYLTGE